MWCSSVRAGTGGDHVGSGVEDRTCSAPGPHLIQLVGEVSDTFETTRTMV